METIITKSSKETRKLGELLAGEITANQKRPSLFGSFRPRPACRCRRGREARLLIICLEGELGSGKTTFTQGLLKGLKVKGPYTSPTFVIMKKYKSNIYHFDAYRIKDKDILNLGWEEIVADNPPAGGNIIIIEWADRIRKIIPKGAVWIKFAWVDENKRKLTFN